MTNDNEPSTFEPIGDAAARVVEAAVGERVWDGKPISQPGIYKNIPNEIYHGDTKLFIGAYNGFSISSTGLRKFIDRPSAYWAESVFNPRRFPSEEKDYFSFGRAAHTLLLGEDGFAEEYALRPTEIGGKAWQSNRTECKEWMAQTKAAGKSVVTEKDIELIKWMADSMSKHPMVQAGIISGKIERSLFTKRNGIWLKNRPDALPTDSGDILDLKTAADVSNDGISKAIYSAGYHIQAAVARMVYEDIFGAGTFSSFTFVFVEKSPPFDVRVVQLKDADIERGMKQVGLALKNLERCLQTNIWPGYDGWNPGAEYTEMPVWGQRRIDEALLVGEAA